MGTSYLASFSKQIVTRTKKKKKKEIKLWWFLSCDLEKKNEFFPGTIAQQTNGAEFWIPRSPGTSDRSPQTQHQALSPASGSV